jgi:hypothetical protein
VEDDFITIELPLNKKKKKSDVAEDLIKDIEFKNIKETKVVIIFK